MVKGPDPSRRQAPRVRSTVPEGMLSTETIDLLQFAIQQRIDFALWNSELRLSIDMMTNHLVASLSGYVYGKYGGSTTATATAEVARLPRYIPKWLKRRWIVTRTITLDCRPAIVWPDATFAPPEKFGGPIRVVSSQRYDRTQYPTDPN